jgi:hypothetical protein
LTVAATSPLAPELRRAAVEIFNDRGLAGLAAGVVRSGGVEAFERFGRARPNLAG